MSGLTPTEMKRVLVFGGKTGWIGGLIVDLLKSKEIECFIAESRMENREAVSKELDEIRPTHVFNAAGITGRPNIGWCETHKPETIRANIIGMLNVADLCNLKNIHCTVYSTGCIYMYDDEHACGSNVGYTEEDKPNYDDTFYSETKGYVDPMLQCYPNCMTLRVRMPISDDLYPRNFITKIVKYEKVVNIPNSITVLHEMLPASLEMAKNNLTGVYNFTNPGAISHNEVLDLYKKYIDPTYTYKNFTAEEQAKMARSNNELDSTKLMKDLPEGVVVNDVHTAVDLCFQRMKANLTESGWLPDNLPAEFKRN